jgi:hypothetical protein
MLGLVGFALAAPGRHRVPGPLGLDAIEQPDRTPWRARRDPQLSMQPASVLTVRIGGPLTESSNLTDALGQILGQVTNMAARFLTTPKNALDVHLFPETQSFCRIVLYGIKAPPAAARRWLSRYTSSLARRADPARCARPGGRARAGRPGGSVESPGPPAVSGASRGGAPL